MNIQFLTTTALFRGIREEEIGQLLSCLAARETRCAKGEFLLRAGDTVSEVGLVEAGSANIVAHFYWGGSNIFGHVEKGETFAENYAAVPGRELLCDVVAAEETQALFLRLDKLLATCGQTCAFHRRLIQNLLRIAAQKNLALSARMMHIAPRTIRGRLLSYLSERALEAGGAHFVIPYSRQQLADYLGVDRSALSAELGRMRRDGLIACRGREFTLLE